MNHLIRSSILGTAITFAALSPMTAAASDGTITFNGQITSVTCNISGNGGGSSFTVTLPTVSTGALGAAGVTAGRTPFNIVLSGASCTNGAVASTYFEPGATVDSATGKLKNSTGTATNVQLGLLNGDATAIVLGAPQASQNSKSVTIASNTGTLNYFVEYVATGGAATAGTVGSTVTYSISYN